MGTIILDSFESQNTLVNSLKSILEQKGEEFSWFKLKDKDIKPCRCCGACAFKSPGKCIIDDDIHEIMRALAKSTMIIMLTPVRFGGYSSHLKKVIDRTMPMGYPLYFVKDGHLLHPMRYGHKFLIGIGVTEGNITGQEENFKTLVANNALNMQFTHKTLVLKQTDDTAKIENEIENIIGDILQPRN